LRWVKPSNIEHFSVKNHGRPRRMSCD
jgi:hypothetical protein